ncbi:MAG: DUF302 domain-containing protein [Alphaproteobacteria bacterium]|nr:DUF302 domain-containing protein [Alphaproteobacteria bacterium]MBU1280089.1 DUF302 domain-containing protein [Alphaproteobacteria bacterium]MBU1571865.1 DUF302 domain-containing protein [Alphaproteobacteria bacterium]MBU1828676.1 DUF302 domain-containing protein [Alphaproteobacteria bacterium]MBU2079898.1 DUF302 domain-containing protein [Alphaproteobacteria bacterium]
MKTMIKAIAVGLICAFPAFAEDQAITFDYDGTFEDATFAIEDAIVSKGLVIDYRSHTGEMLERTRADVGSDVVLFDAADVFLFCSAVVSRQVMEADPANIVHCPYSIYVADQAGKVTIGFHDYPDGPMQAVEDLLTEIVEEATSF